MPPMSAVSLVLSLAAMATTVWTAIRERKRREAAIEDAYAEGVKYGLAQRRHEWYQGYRQGQREERRRAST